MSRIVLFGATGFTGELTARRLVADGATPLLVARREPAVAALAAELAVPHAVADVDRPGTLRAVLDAGDVLISTVGPFQQWGGAAIRAALDAGAHYLDSTGEPPFIRRVFDEFDRPAREAGVVLLPAMGYDYLPGNLAGALALHRSTRDGGPAPTGVRVGYFLTGRAGTDAMSRGTRASAAGVMLEPSFGYREGRLQAERGALRVHTFVDERGRRRSGISVGGSEHLTLPRLSPDLEQVEVYLGWADRFSRAVQLLSAGASVAAAVPGVRPLLTSALTRRGSPAAGATGGAGTAAAPKAARGPDAQARAGTGSLVIAEAWVADGVPAARVVLRGPNPYDLTACLLSWAARRISSGSPDPAPGAAGPVEVFGLEDLVAGAASAGLVRDQG